MKRRMIAALTMIIMLLCEMLFAAAAETDVPIIDEPAQELPVNEEPATDKPMPEATKTPDIDPEPSVDVTAEPTIEPSGSPTTEPTIEPVKKKKGLKKRKIYITVENWAESAVYPEEGLKIPLIYQYDFKTVLCYYNGNPRTVSRSGCAAACLSMVVAYLTGNMEQNPESILLKAINLGEYKGKGMSQGAVKAMAKKYGVKGKWVGLSEDELRATLEDGVPVIAHMGKGAFTDKGHYIVIRGLNSEGLALVNDPNSEENSAKAFPLDQIIHETKTDDPFMPCYKKE